MLCKLRTTKRPNKLLETDSDTRRCNKFQKTKHACIVEAHEPTKDHEDHIAEKGFKSSSHCHLVHKFVPMPQALNILDVKAVDICSGLSQPFGQPHSSERARLGCCTDFLQRMWWTLRALRTEQRARTTHVDKDDTGRLTTTSRNKMSVEQCERRGLHLGQLEPCRVRVSAM